MPLALVRRRLAKTTRSSSAASTCRSPAVITLCVVVASYTMAQGEGGLVSAPARRIRARRDRPGHRRLNATLVRVLGLPSIIATLGTFSILEGASLLLRDHPEGPINGDVIDA